VFRAGSYVYRNYSYRVVGGYQGAVREVGEELARELGGRMNRGWAAYPGRKTSICRVLYLLRRNGQKHSAPAQTKSRGANLGKMGTERGGKGKKEFGVGWRVNPEFCAKGPG